MIANIANGEKKYNQFNLKYLLGNIYNMANHYNLEAKWKILKNIFKM